MPSTFNEWFNGPERLNTQFDDWFQESPDGLYDEKKEQDYDDKADEAYERKRAFE